MKKNTIAGTRIVLGLLLLLLIGPGCTSKAPPVPVVPKRDLKYPVPDGADAKGLLDFINKMAAQETAGNTDEERTIDLGHLMESRCAAAEMIMEGDEAEVFGSTAASIKLESLRVLSNTGREGGAEDFLAYATELSESKNSETARYGRLGLFQGEVDKVLLPEGKPEDTVEAVRTLLDKETVKDRILLDVSAEAMEILAAIGFPDEAGEVADLLSTSFDDNEDAELASLATAVAARGKVLRLNGVFREMMMGDRDAEKVFVDTTQAVLASQPAVEQLGRVMDYAQQVENNGKIKVAGKVYDQLGAALEEAPSGDDLVETIRGGLERARKRLDLVGKPFEVNGQTVDGKEVKWEDYEGKLVVVDFWATWCGPCVAELPGLLKHYEEYHEKGLEVIGVNLDTTKEPLDAFLKENELPWPSVVHFSSEDDPEANPIAERYGVETIPFVVLVDPKGNVAAIHARGDRLAGEISFRIDDTFDPKEKEKEEEKKPVKKESVEKEKKEESEKGSMKKEAEKKGSMKKEALKKPEATKSPAKPVEDGPAKKVLKKVLKK